MKKFPKVCRACYRIMCIPEEEGDSKKEWCNHCSAQRNATICSVCKERVPLLGESGMCKECYDLIRKLIDKKQGNVREE